MPSVGWPTVPNLTLDQVTLALAGVAALALLAFLVVLFLALRLRRLRKEYVILRGDAEERDILGAVGGAMHRVDAVEQRLDSVVENQHEQAAIGRFALQKFHMVRYDAFDDMGGRLSFSAALLDDHGDGLVITSINGRTETRTYAKQVVGLTSEHNLSEEERGAIAGAAAGHARGEARTSVSR